MSSTSNLSEGKRYGWVTAIIACFARFGTFRTSSTSNLSEGKRYGWETAIIACFARFGVWISLNFLFFAVHAEFVLLEQIFRFLLQNHTIDLRFEILI